MYRAPASRDELLPSKGRTRRVPIAAYIFAVAGVIMGGLIAEQGWTSVDVRCVPDATGGTCHVVRHALERPLDATFPMTDLDGVAAASREGRHGRFVPEVALVMKPSSGRPNLVVARGVDWSDAQGFVEPFLAWRRGGESSTLTASLPPSLSSMTVGVILALLGVALAVALLGRADQTPRVG